MSEPEVRRQVRCIAPPTTEVPMPKDRRYALQREWCGHARPRWVARFCDQWIGSSASALGGRHLIADHAANRLAQIQGLAASSV